MTIYIIRGIPGSGKSTYAQKLIDLYHKFGSEIRHYEADMFFMKNGSYNFDVSHIKEAHEWCQSKVEEAMIDGVDVIVSNTFTKLWEFAPYIDMAHEYGYEIKVIRLNSRYKNVHNVPEDVIKNMLDRFEDYENEFNR